MADYRIQVLDRAFMILDSLADSGRELGLSELSLRVGLRKSTMHRLVSALEQHRFLRKSSRNNKYRLGERLIELGFEAAGQGRLIKAAKPLLERLVAGSGETAHLGVIQNGSVVSLCGVESLKTLRTPSTVGRRTPCHCSSLGEAILAFLPPDERTKITDTIDLPRFTANTIRTLDALEAELAVVREEGIAFDREEYEIGLSCMGAPVHDERGAVIAAISIAGPTSRLASTNAGELRNLVKTTAAKLSAALGFKPSRAPSFHAKAPGARGVA